jgi:hypothetical protein
LLDTARTSFGCRCGENFLEQIGIPC